MATRSSKFIADDRRVWLSATILATAIIFLRRNDPNANLFANIKGDFRDFVD